PGPYGLLGLRLARKHQARIVVGFHTHFERLTDLYWKRSLGLGKVFRYYLESCNRLLFRHASVVLANSGEMVELARRIGAPSAELMGTTIPRPFIDTPVSPLRDELAVVTFAGRLAAEKNLQAIVAAAEQLPGVDFRIAGDGPERNIIVDAAARLANLDYLGWTPREKMLEVIDATDMLILPSHVESFGTIALEAMTRNRTVLVSASCGITQWPDLSPGLFRIGDGETAADAIARVASLDPAVRRQKAHLGREAAVALNEWTLQHWIDVLTRQMSPHAAHA
ncbi:MAG: glycosyltransferase, partial [Gammaproteobacteria bacterium]|nr:glycosyltransferase [Gammaproteobacteria bacterium]